MLGLVEVFQLGFKVMMMKRLNLQLQVKLVLGMTSVPLRVSKVELMQKLATVLFEILAEMLMLRLVDMLVEE